MKHEERTKEEITELESLMRGKHNGTNSSGNLKIAGSVAGGIAKTLIYGKERKSAVDMEIGEIKKSISDFARKVKNGENWEEKQYLEKKKEST